jgi:hypothetical protein
VRVIDDNLETKPKKERKIVGAAGVVSESKPSMYFSPDTGKLRERRGRCLWFGMKKTCKAGTGTWTKAVMHSDCGKVVTY